MRVIDKASDFEKVTPGCVLTIGNFDGLHMGHQAILAAARRIAGERQAEMVVMTFEPHPVAVLHPERAPGVLTPLVLKLQLLQEYADDCIIVLEGNRELLALSAEGFVDKFLMATIKPAVIVEGPDFNFGAGRAGDIEALSRFGRKKGFEVVVVPPEQIKLATGQAIRVSSTMIRYMLESGHVADAAVALSRPYRLMGEIIPGRGRGKELGFPTLNMAKPDQIIPAEGVYAGFVAVAKGRAELLGKRERTPGVFSIGQARTFGELHPLLIEAHLFTDHPAGTVGHWMGMDFVRHLRKQHKFSSPEHLAKQIAVDCRQAKEVQAQIKPDK